MPERFVKRLQNYGSEQKRKIIGNEFVRIRGRSCEMEMVLGQGTLYADIVESGTSQKE